MSQCSGCPFLDGVTEEAERIQNYGCLPTQQQILRVYDEANVNWACHDDSKKICAGLMKECPFRIAPLVDEKRLEQMCLVARIVAP